MTLVQPGRAILEYGSNPFPMFVKPPVGAAPPPCPEAVIKSTNLARDPGFEDGNLIGGEHFDNGQGLWVIGTPAFPEATGDLDPYTNVDYYGDVDTPSYVGNWFALSTANPRSGTNHARFTAGATGAGSFSPYIVPVGLDACRLPFTSVWKHHLVSGRCDPGDTVNIRAFVMDDEGTGSDVWELQTCFYDDNAGAGGAFGCGVTGFASQASYTQITRSVVAPANSVWWTGAVIVIHDFVTSGSVFDVDDVEIEVT